MNDYLNKLEERKLKMIQYLLLKVEEQDWHGTADAAMDIRDIEAEKIGYENSQKQINEKYERLEIP